MYINQSQIELDNSFKMSLDYIRQYNQYPRMQTSKDLASSSSETFESPFSYVAEGIILLYLYNEKTSSSRSQEKIQIRELLDATFEEQEQIVRQYEKAFCS